MGTINKVSIMEIEIVTNTKNSSKRNIFTYENNLTTSFSHVDINDKNLEIIGAAFFGGLTFELSKESELLGIELTTRIRDWKFKSLKVPDDLVEGRPRILYRS